MPPARTTSTGSKGPPLEDINLFSSDVALQEAMTREGAGQSAKRLSGFGLMAGSAEVIERGRIANAHRPELVTHDRDGVRCNRIDYHPAYHDLMEMSVSEGLQATAWIAAAAKDPVLRPGLYVERAGGLYMAAQVDAGHVRSISMTHSAVPALSHEAPIAAAWVPKIISRSHDRSDGTITGKASCTLSFAFAEHAADGAGTVHAQAKPLTRDESGALYAVSGLKWNAVAPTADGLIVLAHTSNEPSKKAKGVSCFLAPRILPDDERNTLHLRRLKDTMGLRSSACAEIEFDNAHAWLLGEEGHGLDVISETILHARLDTVIVTAGLMRQCLAQALNFTEHHYDGRAPLSAGMAMKQTLADMALDAEVAAALGFRLARAFDRATDIRAAAWRRLMTPVSVYWVSRRAPVLAAEAMDCFEAHGGLEDWPATRLYRDCAAAAMADGSANSMAFEVLRILQREPNVAETVMEELGQAAGDDPHLRAAHARVEAILQDPRHLDARGRLLLESLATLAAGTILRAHGPAPIADAFIKSRMGNQPRQSYGQGLEWVDMGMIVRRASPHQV